MGGAGNEGADNDDGADEGEDSPGTTNLLLRYSPAVNGTDSSLAPPSIGDHSTGSTDQNLCVPAPLPALSPVGFFFRLSVTSFSASASKGIVAGDGGSWKGFSTAGAEGENSAAAGI